MKIPTISNYLLMINLLLIIVNLINSESILYNNYNNVIDNIENNNCYFNYNLIENSNNKNNKISINSNGYNNNNNYNISCYRNNLNRDIVLNCKGDKNQEFNKIQNSNFIIDQNIVLITEQLNNNSKILILEQSFKTYPTGNGSYIINNVNEHIAFFQTLFKLENTIICNDISEFQNNNQKNIIDDKCGNIKLEEYIYQDPYGKTININNNQKNNNDELKDNTKLWNVLDESNGIKSKLLYHQNYPFNTIEHLPTNKNLWFKESIKKMKIGKTIPQQSFTSISGKLISKWTIPYNLEFILINATYIHTMGDLILSGRHVEHNDYKIVEYGIYDIKMLNLNTNEIIPFKKKSF